MTSKTETTERAATLRPAELQTQAYRDDRKTAGGSKDALLTDKSPRASCGKQRLKHTVLIVLANRWRLCGDNSQWRLEHFVAPKWRPVAFVASEKAVLMRLLREKGVDLSPEAIRALDCLPDRFRDWRDQQIANCNNLEKMPAPKRQKMPRAAKA